MRAPAATLLALSILVAACGVRIFAASFPHRLIGDERYYAGVALSIARGRGHVSADQWAFRPPAHPWLLSFAIEPRSIDRFDTAHYPRALLNVQIALGTAMVGATMLLGLALFDRRTALLAGAAAAAYPALVAHSHYLWSEMLFGTLVTLAIAAVVFGQARGSPLWAAAAGLAFGLAALTRDLAVGIACVCAVWWVWNAPASGRRRAAACAALLVGLAVLTVAPWTARNYARTGRFVPVSTVGWFAIAEGNALERSDWRARSGPVRLEFRHRYFARADERDRLDFARAYALERIGAEQPAWILKKFVRNVPLLLSPDSNLFEKIRRGAYGEVRLDGVRALLVLSAITWIAVFAGALLGGAGAPRGRASLFYAICGAVLAIHLLANASARFRVPWLPFLLAYAAFAFSERAELLRRLRGGKWIAPAIAIAVFTLLCLPVYFERTEPLWALGSDAGPWPPPPSSGPAGRPGAPP